MVGNQTTLKKTLAADDLKPGAYKIRIRVTDKRSGQTIESSEKFVVD